MSNDRPTTRRILLSLGWLIAFPIADVIFIAVYSPVASASAMAIVFTVFATLVFWLGAFLLWQQFLLTADSCHRNQWRRLALAWSRIGLTGFHLYFALLWGITLGGGHLPNPDSIVFLMDNFTRVPQHVIQTSPLLLLAVLSIVTGTALLTERAIRNVSNKVGLRVTWQVPSAVLCSLVAWYLLTPMGIAWSPLAFALTAKNDERIDVRARVMVDELASKSTLQEPVAPPERMYPVIVILVESLRSDLLKNYPDAIPFLKSLHDTNIGFDLSYATASHSNLTDLAFWYSQYPLRGAGKEAYPVDAPWRGTSLFRAFKEASYATAYVSSQNERWGNMVNWLNTDDVDYFFDSEHHGGETWENYDDRAGLGGMLKRGLVTAGKVEDSETLEVAKRWIASTNASSGFLLGMNLQNTHFSYVMPPNGVEPYQPSELGFRTVYYRWPESEKANVRNRYLNAVANVDRLLQGFADYLKARGVWDECLFVVVGDNGEAFYEHGFGNHSGPMYDEAVRTFSVIKLPKSLQHRAMHVTRPISHIDIAATIPDLAGIAVPKSFQGMVVRSANGVQRPVYMYSNAIVRQFGIVSWPWKFLLTEFPEMREELYRLDTDPHEKVNLAQEGSLQKDVLYASLRLWISTQSVYYASRAYESKVPPLYDAISPVDSARDEY